jgi:hypothetical protein
MLKNKFFLTLLGFLLWLFQLSVSSQLESMINLARQLEGDPGADTGGDTADPGADTGGDTTDPGTGTKGGDTPETSNEPTPSQLAQNIQNSIRDNLIMKQEVSKRLYEKIAFDANRAKWIMANQIDIDDSKRNEVLRIFPKLVQKLIKNSIIADFSYPQMKFK